MLILSHCSTQSSRQCYAKPVLLTLSALAAAAQLWMLQLLEQYIAQDRGRLQIGGRGVCLPGAPCPTALNASLLLFPLTLTGTTLSTPG